MARPAAAKTRRDGEYAGPSGAARFVPADVARSVYERDSYECQFVLDSGRKCRWPHELRLHDVAWSRAGATSADDLRVHCRCHDLYQTELDFGRGEAA